MSESNDFSRREFMRKTASVGAAVPYFVSASALGKGEGPGANEKINIGLIGCGPMGRINLSNCAKYPDVVVTGVCDPWKERRDSALQKYQNTAKPYNDYRQMLQQKDIDAVIIATPPHWHALMAIDACEAGKDILCAETHDALSG